MFCPCMYMSAHPRQVLQNMTITMDDIRYKLSEKQLEMRLRDKDHRGTAQSIHIVTRVYHDPCVSILHHTCSD